MTPKSILHESAQSITREAEAKDIGGGHKNVDTMS